MSNERDATDDVADIIEIVQTNQKVEIPIEKLQFNKNNLRLAHLGNVSPSTISSILWSRFKLQKLYQNIRLRGLQEPLILHPDNNVVLEGNRRLAVLQTLAKEAEAEVKDKIKNPKLTDFFELKVPCYRIKKGTPDVDIEAYLVSIHVARKEPWEKYDRAKMLHKLLKIRKLKLGTVSKLAEISPNTVRREVETYEILTTYNKTFEDENWINKFYHIWEFTAPKISNLRKDPNSVYIFLEGLNRDFFITSKDVREVVKHIASFEPKKISKGMLTIEKDELEKYTPSFKSKLYTSIAGVIRILDNFTDDEIQKALDDSERKNFIKMLSSSSQKLLKKIEHKENVKR